MKHRARVLVAGGLLLFGAATCFLVFFISSHAVPIAKFEQVTDGMTQAQVKDMLGQPLVIRHDHPNTNAYYPDETVFFYGGLQRLKWCSMEVQFGSNGRVTGKFHDH